MAAQPIPIQTSAATVGGTPLTVEACFERFRAQVYRWARGLTGDHHAALDVVQEVFVRMLRSRPELAGDGAALGWLRRATASAAIDLLRGRRRRGLALVRLGEQPPRASGAGSLAAGDNAAVAAAMLRLSGKQRLVLMCKFYEDLSLAQTAIATRLSLPTVKTHYVRGLAKIRAALNRNDGDES